MSVYLNRENIDLINKVKAKARKKGKVVAQTNSRRDGNYLSAVRIYNNAKDKGKPDKAIRTITTKAGLQSYLR